MWKLFTYFWIVFIGYFIFIHPAIIYDATTPDDFDLAGVDPNSALLKLGLSIFLWFFIFLISFVVLFKSSFLAKRRMQQIQKNGLRLQAKIIKAKSGKTLSKNQLTQTIVVEFLNREHEMVQYEMMFIDSKPEARRYEVGNTLWLRMDETLKREPYLHMEEAFGVVKWRYFLFWGLAICAIVGYYYYYYIQQHAGYGWRFLTFDHPLIISACCLIGFSLIAYLPIKFLFLGKLKGSGDGMILLLIGKRVVARIVKLEQTGLLINDQPEIKFEIEFEDAKGIIQQHSIKKIVSLLDLATVKSLKEDMVFYDPENPKNVMFESDLMPSYK